METLLDRFLDYVRIDTGSNEDSNQHPSTAGQLQLAKLLENQLRELGLVNVVLSENGYITAILPANTARNIPVLGLLAHLDTSPEVSGKNVRPQVHSHYNGLDLPLNPAQNLILRHDDNPELDNYLGQTLITSDGTTLLGADDKAGIAIIMSCLDHLVKHCQVEHGKIVVGFTPDEEIGRGADCFDVAGFGADWAYTVDGGPIGELEYENFNAATAHIFIHGVNVHPGSAWGKMKNALLIAMELQSMLPPQARPEFTRGYEGFYHLNHLMGSVDQAEMNYLIRDHDRTEFENKKGFMLTCVDMLNDKYGQGTVELKVKDQYFNMKEKIEPVMHIVELARQAMLGLAIPPVIKPIRGGTDGARLAFLGLPCPNLFTGGHNFHSRYEYISLESMQAAVNVLLKIIEMMFHGPIPAPEEAYASAD